MGGGFGPTVALPLLHLLRERGMGLGTPTRARAALGSSVMLDHDLNPAAGFSAAQSDCQTSHDTLCPSLAQWL